MTDIIAPATDADTATEREAVLTVAAAAREAAADLAPHPGGQRMRRCCRDGRRAGAETSRIVAANVGDIQRASGSPARPRP